MSERKSVSSLSVSKPLHSRKGNSLEVHRENSAQIQV